MEKMVLRFGSDKIKESRNHDHDMGTEDIKKRIN